MGIFFPDNLRTILELKVKKPGQKAEDLNDEHDTSDGYSTKDDEYSVKDDTTEEEPENDNTDTATEEPAGDTPDNTEPTDDTTTTDTEQNDTGGTTEDDYSLNDTDVDNAEGDNQTEEQPADDTTTAEEQPADDTTNAEDPNDNPDDTSTAGDDYSLDDAGSEDTTTDDTTDSSTDMANTSGGEKSELQNMEGDLFKDLTPEQLEIKTKELKQRYIDVYESIDNIMTRLNKISKTQENIKVLQFVTNKLLELKQLVYYYLTNTFDTKTYIENSINYQEYLATISVVNKIFKQINTEKK